MLLPADLRPKLRPDYVKSLDPVKRQEVLKLLEELRSFEIRPRESCCNHGKIMLADRRFKLLVEAAVAHDQQPVANGEQFLEFRRNDDDANSAARQIYQNTVDLLPGAYVDPPRWLIANQQLGAAQQCAREQGFLLVTAAKHSSWTRKGSGLGSSPTTLMPHWLGSIGSRHKSKCVPKLPTIVR